MPLLWLLISDYADGLRRDDVASLINKLELRLDAPSVFKADSLLLAKLPQKPTGQPRPTKPMPADGDLRLGPALLCLLSLNGSAPAPCQLKAKLGTKRPANGFQQLFVCWIPYDVNLNQSEYTKCKAASNTRHRRAHR